jgi:hypothetical protein
MFSESKKRAIGLISTQEEAKKAVQKLKDDGFSREQISIIGPNSCGYACQKDFNLSRSSNNALISGLAATDVGSVFTTGALSNIVANNAVGFLNKGLIGSTNPVNPVSRYFFIHLAKVRSVHLTNSATSARLFPALRYLIADNLCRIYAC